MNRSELTQLVVALNTRFAENDYAGAAEMLSRLEGRVFLAGDQFIAAELAYARHLIQRDDPAGALDVVGRLTPRATR